MRYAAAQAFEESLQQLQHRLETGEGQGAHRSAQANPPAAPAGFDLDSFEAAIADIDQFMQATQPRSVDQSV